MPLVRVGDVNFNIEVEGPFKAPFLMLSNSLGTNYHMWDPQMAEFTRQFRVVRYDSRGHGRSQANEGPYSIASLGRDALAIMDALGVSKTHWVGLSQGGMVGQWLLTNAPQRIERAVLANTAAQMGSADFWNNRIRTARSSGMSTLATASIDRWFTKDFQRSQPGVVEGVLAMLNATPTQGYAASCSAIRDMDQRESIRSINKPVLVIVGRHDQATPPSLGKLLASSIPGAKLATLDAAHLSNIEDAPNFTKAVVDFLNGKEVTIAKPPARKAAPAKAAAKAAVEPKAPAKKEKSPAKKAAAKKAPSKKPASKGPPKKAAKKSASAKTAKKSAAKKVVKPKAKKAAPVKRAIKKAVKKSPAKKAGRSAKKRTAR